MPKSADGLPQTNLHPFCPIRKTLILVRVMGTLLPK